MPGLMTQHIVDVTPPRIYTSFDLAGSLGLSYGLGQLDGAQYVTYET
ncbi:hypothetical protein PAEVO_19340 [Paenibacillus sp. GM2FR]|nr:hypothetical protein PAEVO_19340 [Paenibacillus sp. GM2FR]